MRDVQESAGLKSIVEGALTSIAEILLATAM